MGGGVETDKEAMNANVVKCRRGVLIMVLWSFGQKMWWVIMGVIEMIGRQRYWMMPDMDAYLCVDYDVVAAGDTLDSLY
nr:hypothetical protein [Tanacetum cinerariifolium]